MGKPLDGITVFDITFAGVGPFATASLAALGADVVKIEAPGGDLQQRIPPYQRGFSTLYACANIGKRSIELDLKDPTQRSQSYEILRRADVFIENMRPGAADRLGFDPATVRRISPDIVHVNVSAWGSGGPMGQDSGSDGPVQAFSGFTSLNGRPGGPSEFLRAYGHIDYTTSQVVVMAVLDALLRRQRTGEGQHIDCTMLGAMLLLQFSPVATYLATGEVPERMGSSTPLIVPDQAFECLDGEHIAVSALTDHHWRQLVAALGAEDLAADADLDANPGRVAQRQRVVARLADLFRTKPARWWELCLQRAAVPVARPLEPSRLPAHPQVSANDMIVAVPTRQAGTMTLSNFPWRFSDATIEVVSPTTSGRDSEEIADQYFGDAVGEPPVRSFGHERVDASLQGVTVVDLTQGFCGPLAGMLLADLGARVLKLEPAEGDCARRYGPPFVDDVAPAYWHLNRLKEVSLADWTGDGRVRLAELLGEADVVLEDDGSVALGIDDLLADHPRAVRCVISGYGDLGPLAGLPASELAVQTLTGTTAGLGVLGEPPVRVGSDVASSNAAFHAVQGVLAALLDRRKSGRGQVVRVNLLQSLIYLRGGVTASQGDPDEWVGHPLDHFTQPPATGWRTKDLPVTFVLGRPTQAAFEDLMRELHLEDCLDDPRFRDQGQFTLGSRIHSHEVRHLWERATMQMTSEEFSELIVSRGGEVQRLNDYPTLFAHPQIDAIGALRKVEHPSAGTVTALDLPWHLQSAGPRPDSAGA